MSPAEDTKDTHLVFIYGTLKKGYPNSQYMPASAKYAGTACTTAPWPLVIDTEMGIPYLLLVPDHPNAKIIEGELYHVDETGLEIMDNFEGLPTGFYIREELDLIYPCGAPDSIPEAVSSTSDDGASNAVITATAYFRSPANGGPEFARKWTVDRLLTLPMVNRYTQVHALGYVPRLDRDWDKQIGLSS